MNRETQKRIIVSGIAIIAFYWILHHYEVFFSALSFVYGLISPFILGCAIAFIINVPMKSIENHINFKGKFEKLNRLKKVMAYCISLIGVLLVFALVIMVAVPELVSTFKMLLKQIPEAYDKMIKQMRTLLSAYPQIEEYMGGLRYVSIDWENIISKLGKLFGNGTIGAVSSGISVISGAINAATTFGIGFIFSIYLLFQKEKLILQGKKVAYALLKKEEADKLLSVLTLSNKVFAGFLSGQCLEALILGTLVFVAMTIFRLPYALLISIIIAVTALIPILGGFIGCAVGIFLIVIVNPIQALIFTIIFLVLQQIEGNLIYPHVVGNSVGLPGIWVLVAVTIGGNLMGIIGMILFIPITSVCYTLFKEHVYKRLKQKKISF